MSSSKLNSYAALAMAVVTPLAAFFQPEINGWFSKNPMVGVIIGTLIGVWNNLAHPVNK